MDLDAFIRERESRWNRLNHLLDRTDDSPEWEMEPRTIQELVGLYRQACSDLNHARSLTANPAVLERLNQLTGRGYRYVYRNTRRVTLWESTKRLFVVEIPSTFRKEFPLVGAAAAAMLLGAVVGFGAVISNPHQARDIIPSQLFTESPRQRVERLENTGERIGSVESAGFFAAFLYTHNIKVSFLVFALGAMTIVGGYALLFYNGMILGAVAAQYVQDDVTVFFLAWVGPHGALELPAIIFAGAAGLCLGRALLMPGSVTTATSLRAVMPTVRRMMLATGAILVIAGQIEGSFSQFTSRTFPYPLKIGVGALLFVLLVAYLFLPRRRAAGPSGMVRLPAGREEASP